MRNHRGRVIIAGILCATAATVALWSGPLASASGALHTSATQHVSHVSSTARHNSLQRAAMSGR